MSLALSIFGPMRFLRSGKSENIFFYLGQKGQPSTDPCGHVDLRQRNKNVRFGNYKNFAELFNLQVTRKEIYCKTFRITLSKKNACGVLAQTIQASTSDLLHFRISYCSADATFTHVFAFIAVNRAECLQCHAFLARKQKIVSNWTLNLCSSQKVCPFLQLKIH